MMIKFNKQIAIILAFLLLFTGTLVNANDAFAQDVNEGIAASKNLPVDTVVYRVMNAEGNFSLMNNVCDTNINLYANNNYFRDTLNGWWNLWMGSNLTANASTALELIGLQYGNGKTKAFYDGFYGDLFMNYSEPSTLTENCAEIVYQLIHKYPETITRVNEMLPTGVNSADLSIEDLSWYLERVDSDKISNLLNNYSACIEGIESIKDTWSLVFDIMKEAESSSNGLKATFGDYITNNISNVSVSNIGIGMTLGALGGIADLGETKQKLDEGHAVYDLTKESIQCVVDKANLEFYYDDPSAINNIKQSWAAASNDYSNIPSTLINDAGLSGFKWFINESVNAVLGNPALATWNLMISVGSLGFNSEIKNSILFSQYCVGNNILIAAKDVYLTNIVKLNKVLLGQLTVSETEFQDIQNNLRSSVAVIYLVKGQLTAYERELSLAFFPNGGVEILPASYASQYKKLGIDFLQYKNVKLEDVGRTNEGTGSQEDPYIITTASQLDKIRNGLDKHYVLAADIDLSEFNNGVWIPLGIPKEHPFTGSLSGNGHSINNLNVINGVVFTIKYSASDIRQYSYAGLFSEIEGAEIFDLNINSSLTGKVSAKCESGQGNIAGGIVGKANNSQISNCNVYGITVTAENTGGIVGGGANLKITNCYFSGRTEGRSSAGGIAGWIENGVINSCTVEKTVINAYSGSYNGLGHAGGITGSIYESIISASQAVNCTVSSTYSGGLVGATGANYGNNTISKCFSSGSVYGTGRVGGLIGKVDRNTKIDNSGSLSGVSVSNPYCTAGDGLPYNTIAGGFIGLIDNENSIDIQNCYSAGKVSTSGNFTADKIRIGSFAGYGSLGWSYTSDWKIKDCFVDADTNGTMGAYGQCGINVTFPLVKSTTDMKEKDTYSGWDFDNVWSIDGITNNGYPFLRDLKQAILAGIVLNQDVAQIKVGEIIYLSVTIYPENNINKNIVWSTSDEDIATVDETGKVTAKGFGTSIIMVKTTEGNHTASCTVKVGPSVIFNSNGGTDVESQHLRQNEKAVTPTEPTRKGYSFGGWYTDDGTFAKVFNFENTLITEDITLYAMWTLLLKVITQPVDMTVYVGEAAILSVEVEASAETGTLSYRWYSNITNSTSGGSIVNGATSSSYSSPTKETGTTYYYCSINNTENSAQTISDIAKVVVNDTVINQDQVAPTGLTGIDPTSADNNDGKITGVSSAMEYKLSTAISYTVVTGTTITGLASGTYYVRYAAKAGYNAGADTAIAVPANVNIVPVFSKNANNLTHGYDKNYDTYANILKSDGYIIYKLSDLGLAGGTIGQFTLSASDRSSQSVGLEYLDAENKTIGSGIINISGYKNAYTADITANAVYVKIKGIPTEGYLSIYEVGVKTTTATTKGQSKDANNLTHAYDGSYSTSANIFTSDGYIIYKLTDLGLTSGTGCNFTINASDGSSQSIQLEYLDAEFQPMGTSSINVSGYKNTYKAGIVDNAIYVKITGISSGYISIFEIAAIDPSTTPEISLYKYANNLTHAHDGSTSTSANIFTSEGYIIYKLTDLGLTRETNGSYIINASDGSSQDIGLDYLGADFETIGTSTLAVSGIKKTYTADITANAVYLKIKGIVGANVYIYEITKTTASLTSPTTDLSKQANNLTHAYDGSYSTSANIFASDGYIIYKLTDLGLTSGTICSYTINASDRSSQSIGLEYLDTDLNTLGTSALNVSGYKNTYKTGIAANAVYLKIKGIDGAYVYIYEIEAITATPPTPSATNLSKDANNLTHANDGSCSTSANILSSDGYIIYKISDVGLTSGTNCSYTINASDGSSKSIEIEYLDTDLNTLGTSTLNVSGDKNTYKADITANAVYLKIKGIEGANIYIYEIEATDTSSSASPPVTELWKEANNLNHAYDGSCSTSANIFTSGGYIIYKLSDLGLTSGTGCKYTINASDGSSQSIGLEYLDADFKTIGTSTLAVSGIKNTYTATITANAGYLKIKGISGGAFVSIYEMATP